MRPSCARARERGSWSAYRVHKRPLRGEPMCWHTEQAGVALSAEHAAQLSEELARRGFAVLDRGRRVVEDEIAGLTDELIKKHLTVRLVKAKKLRKNA